MNNRTQKKNMHDRLAHISRPVIHKESCIFFLLLGHRDGVLLNILELLGRRKSRTTGQRNKNLDKREESSDHREEHVALEDMAISTSTGKGVEEPSIGGSVGVTDLGINCTELKTEEE